MGEMVQKLARGLRRPWRLWLVLALLAAGGFAASSIGWSLWADHHFRAAQQALEKSDLDLAQTHLKLCLQVRGDNPDIHFLLARTARRAGDHQLALRHLAECQRRGGIPEAVQMEMILAAVQSGDMSRHEPYLRAALHKDHPDTVFILEALAQGYLRSFRLQEALDCLNLWLRREPDNVQALFWRAETLDHLQRPREALQVYRRVVQVAPQHPAARLALGEALLVGAHPQEALPHYESLYRDTPGNPKVLLGLARCYLDTGQPQKARPHLDALLAGQPANPQALLQRGRAEMDLERPQQAEPWLRKAAALEPYERETVHLLLQCLSAVGRKDEVPHWVDQLKRIDTKRRRLVALTKRIATETHTAPLRVEAGEIFLEIGNPREGLRWLQSALQQDPSNRRARELLEKHASPRAGRDAPTAPLPAPPGRENSPGGL